MKVQHLRVHCLYRTDCADESSSREQKSSSRIAVPIIKTFIRIVDVELTSQLWAVVVDLNLNIGQV